MGEAQANAWVQALLDPAAWPHPVGQIELIETHISLVILTGDFAYKIKKPVDLGFLDFSTLAARKYYCEEELRLNRRLAPQIYLAVIPIGGSPAAPRPGAADGVFEYAVQMRQFPQAAQLDNRLAAGELSAAQVDAVADMVAGFHERAGPSADPAAGSPDAVLAPFRDNLEALGTQLDESGAEPLTALDDWLTRHQASLEPMFASRREQGRVRDVHGDLHLRNLAWIDDEPVAFDCIEFDPALRTIDVMNDIAFTVMDLHFHEQHVLAWRLLNRYLETGGDYEGLAVMGFYLAYRACVRAKIDAIRAGQGSGGAAAEAMASARRHLDLAAGFVHERRGRLVITRGMSGSGKSRGSVQLLAPLEAIRLRSDVERKRLAGMAAGDSGRADWAEGIYDPAMTARTYARLAELARTVLASGRSAIVDATFADAGQRRQFRALAESMQVPFHILEFTAPARVLRERVAGRSGGASDADLAVLERQLEQWTDLGDDEFGDRIVVDTTLDFDPQALAARITAEPG